MPSLGVPAASCHSWAAQANLSQAVQSLLAVPSHRRTVKWFKMVQEMTRKQHCIAEAPHHTLYLSKSTRCSLKLRARPRSWPALEAHCPQRSSASEHGCPSDLNWSQRFLPSLPSAHRWQRGFRRATLKCGAHVLWRGTRQAPGASRALNPMLVDEKAALSLCRGASLGSSPTHVVAVKDLVSKATPVGRRPGPDSGPGHSWAAHRCSPCNIRSLAKTVPRTHRNIRGKSISGSILEEPYRDAGGGKLSG